MGDQMIVSEGGARGAALDDGPESGYEHQQEAVGAPSDGCRGTSLISGLLAARRDFLLYATYPSLSDLLSRTLERIRCFVESPIAFYHFVDADQQTVILSQFSGAEGADVHTLMGGCQCSRIESAGVWADALRLRRTVIHNDYLALEHRRGLPPGHAPVIREMVVPVLREEKVVALIGVGNKETAYTEEDAEIVALLGDMSWGIIQRKKAEETLREEEARFKSLYDSMSEGVCLHELIVDDRGIAMDYRVLDCNASYERIVGLPRAAVVNRLASQVYAGGGAPYLDVYSRVVLEQAPAHFETHFAPLDKHFAISVVAQGNLRFATIFTDISERVLASEALRRRSEELETILANIPAMIVYLDEAGRPVWANPYFEMVTGRHVSSLPENDPLLEFYPDASYREEAKRHIAEANGSWREFNMHVLHGAIVPTLWSNVTLCDGSGLGIGLDIRGRKEAEKALREATLREREILKAAKVGLWDWDLVTNRVQYSLEWKRQVGCEDHEIGDSYEEWAQRLHPEDRDQSIKRVYRAIEKRQEVWLQFRFRHKDGSYRWILAQATVVTDASGAPLRMVGSHVDITDKMDAERALAESEERYKRLVENLDDMVYRVELVPDVRMAYISPACFDLTGFTPAEFYANPLLAFERIEPQDRERWCPVVGTEQTKTAASVIRYLHRDGTSVWAEFKSNLIVNEAGEVIAIEGIARDITERKRAERERERLEAQVRHVQKMEAIGQLTGGVAHDFNNLLQVINASTEIARELIPPQHESQELLREVARAGERAARLVTQLLVFSRRQVMRPEQLDLNEVTADLLKMVGRLIGEQVQVEWFPAPELEQVYADRGMIEQALVNLSVNARDAMRSGGRLTFTTDRVVITSQFSQAHAWALPGTYVRIAVRDTGSGMDPETLEHIFEPFFTTKEQGKGTGLGLATVYGIVKQHDGLINVITRVGQGSTFELYFPVSNGVSALPVCDAESPPVQRGHERILLAEDEAMVRRLARLLLEKAGYTVVEAKDGAEAVAIFEAHAAEFELGMLDLVMPVMGGLEASERMRAIRPDFRIVFASGYSEDALDGRVGECPLIQKPFARETMLRAIRESLDRPAR
ncbi:MAG: PAS domain S-box protein [Candidatus Hydrogenedentes bacterium]|nr:PAS domain S-box protein [Candidatus Hydrogenedentota bacterium]